jgi:hypothetical protein
VLRKYLFAPSRPCVIALKKSTQSRNAKRFSCVTGCDTGA